MNDPNGTLYHDGWYHLFYQHDPARDSWGRMHWGHARSRDLVDWELLPVALTPAAHLGEDHCFSGCAWRDEAGRPMLFYTSVRGEHEGFTTEQWAVRCSPDLTTFERVDENPVLGPRGENQPHIGETARDPFIFERSGRTFLTLGAATRPAESARIEGEPALPLFEAVDPDLLVWRYLGDLHRPTPGGRILECPNLLQLQGTDVLLLSPHGPVEYLTGHFAPEVVDRGPAFRPERRGRIDESEDFYATNSFVFEDASEPAIVGWVRGWLPGRGWNGALSTPRRLSLAPDGGLRQRPITAFGTLRGEETRLNPLVIAAGDTGDPVGSRVDFPAASLDVEAEVRVDGIAGLRLRDAVTLAPVLEWWCDEERRVGSLGGIEHPLTDKSTGGRQLRLIWDRSVAELFIDDGRQVCTRVVEAATGGPVVLEWFSRRGRIHVDRCSLWSLDAIW